MPFPRVIPPVVDPLIDLQVVGGVIVDTSPFARTITTNNGVTTSTDVDLGEVMVFSGPGSTYLQLPAFAVGPSYEYECWFKATALHNTYSGSANWLSHMAPHSAGTDQQQWLSVLRRLTATTARVEHYNYQSGIDSGTAGAPIINTNEAHHVKVRVDGTTITMWLDDVLVASDITTLLQATSISNALSDIRMTIGADWDGGSLYTEFLSGYISRIVMRRFSPGDPP